MFPINFSSIQIQKNMIPDQLFIRFGTQIWDPFQEQKNANTREQNILKLSRLPKVHFSDHILVSLWEPFFVYFGHLPENPPDLQVLGNL